jgi:hypothetical protein
LRGAEAIAAGIKYVAEQEHILAEIIDNQCRRVEAEGR